jgi:hypothetical protein
MLSKLFNQVENEYCQEQQKKKDEQAKAEELWKEYIKEREMMSKMSSDELYIYSENKRKKEQEERQKQYKQDEIKAIGEARKIVENEITVYMDNINPEAQEQYDKLRFVMNLKCINRARCSLLLDNFKSLLDMLKKQSDEASCKEVTYSNLLPVHGELTHYSELVKMLSTINKQIEDYKTLLQNTPFRCEKQEPKPPVVVRRTKE